ncbi:MAG: RimJ/RimL family protein N-acetyltransferase [Yoonia sp.]|jgi:RimJ/RimL family protein N-acetyltransferase
MMTPAPIITTKRLTLRGPVASDLAPQTDFIVNSARMEFLGGNGSAQDAWFAFLTGIGHWHMHGYGFFMIVDTATNTPVGRMGILNHVGWPEPELAYHMFDNGEGHGYAFEAGLAVRQWAGETLGLGPLVSIISPTNTRSIALAKRLGAVSERETTHDNEPAIIFRHLAHDSADARAQVTP